MPSSFRGGVVELQMECAHWGLQGRGRLQEWGPPVLEIMKDKENAKMVPTSTFILPSTDTLILVMNLFHIWARCFSK